MSRNTRDAINDAVREFYQVPADIRTLVAATMNDLHYGPCSGRDSYPGFSKACASIASWWELHGCNLWYSHIFGECQAEEPSEDDGPAWDYVAISDHTQRVALFGRELAEYIR